MTKPTQLSYVVPLRWSDDSDWAELEAYLRRLAPLVTEIVIVDGSPRDLFRRHAAAVAGLCRHLGPDPSLSFKMGKVNGVTTGVLAARCERVVIADDDVRYDGPALRRLSALLQDAELVRPQNYFDPLPWHARLDTGRTLLNRVHTGDREFPSGDFPGTLGVRRSAFGKVGGYDGDVMFENLELMRTIKAGGGRVVSPLDLYVRRLPPSSSHYLSQRVRQAYDDFGVPLRMALALSVAPGVLVALAAKRWRLIVAFTAATAATAESGRRRAGATEHYPFSSSLLAPVWLFERGLSAWLAVWSRLRHGGIRYGGQVVPRGANSHTKLCGRLRLEAGDLVGAVAERVDARAAAATDRDRTPA